MEKKITGERTENSGRQFKCLGAVSAKTIGNLDVSRPLSFFLLLFMPYWRRNWQPTPVFLHGESHGQRNLGGYSPQGLKELDTTEQLHFTSFMPYRVTFQGASVTGHVFLALAQVCGPFCLKSPRKANSSQRWNQPPSENGAHHTF